MVNTREVRCLLKAVATSFLQASSAHAGAATKAVIAHRTAQRRINSSQSLPLGQNRPSAPLAYCASGIFATSSVQFFPRQT
jgi:hypothetical protein